MKKMTWSNQHSRRDDFITRNRLFLLLQRYNIFTKSILKIKPNIYEIHTNNGQYILKRFTNKDKLLIQVDLHRYLLNRSYYNITPFLSFSPNVHYIEDEQFYWGIMKKVHSVPFTFQEENDRADALTLLLKFQEASLGFAHTAHYSIPTFHLYERWSNRLHIFQSVSNVRNPIPYDVYKLLIQWGEWTLTNLSTKKLMDIEYQSNKKGKLIHGDCASHNFLRNKEGQLVMTDLDLIAIAPFEYEMIQFVNRIMPHLNWSYSRLKRIQSIQPLLRKDWFLTSLLFPFDWYRELQLAVKQPTKRYYVISRMLDQIEPRVKFVQEIMNMIL
jgi:hypothetical protein